MGWALPVLRVLVRSPLLLLLGASPIDGAGHCEGLPPAPRVGPSSDKGGLTPCVISPHAPSDAAWLRTGVLGVEGQ